MQIVTLKPLFILLGIMQLFIALGAVPAGLMYLWDVSGYTMGTSIDLLKNSPFDNFFWPGLFLLLVHGLGNAIACVFAFRQNAAAAIPALLLGLTLCLWIVFQVYWIGYISVLQPVFFMVGMAEAVLGFLVYKKTSKAFRG